MTVKTFFYGLIASFGIPWLVMLAVPFVSMRSQKAPEFDEIKDGKTGTFQSVYSGRVKTGSLIYGQEGCATCHTQVTRPTYAGNDVFRPGQGGFATDPDRGDTRRITMPFDFKGEEFAHIGESRIGPDLGNYGGRLVARAAEYNKLKAEELEVDIDALGSNAYNIELEVLKHLYDPQVHAEANMLQTNCPTNPRMFETAESQGQQSVQVIGIKDGKEVVPNDRGRALASYLMNLKRDGEVPASMKYGRDNKEESE